MDTTLREATLEDIALINQLAAVTFPATYRDLLSPEQLDYMFEMMYAPQNIQQQMEELHHRYFIAYNKDEACGYISMEKESDTLFELQKIYILPQFQGLGIGRKLINYALHYCKRHTSESHATLELHVNRGNKARYFYEAMGFHVARQGDFEIGNGYYMNDYIMAIEL